MKMNQLDKVMDHLRPLKPTLKDTKMHFQILAALLL